MIKKQYILLLALMLLLTASLYAADATGLGPQVKIKVKVVEWQLSNSLDYGISTIFKRDAEAAPNAIVDDLAMIFPSQAATAQGITLFLDSIGIANSNLEIVLQLLEQSGDVKIISQPTIIAMKGAPNESIIKTTSNVPFEAAKTAGNTVVQVTNFKETGITLQIKVLDVIDDYVKLKINSNVSTLAGYISVATDKDGNPIIVPQRSVRALRNIVLIKDTDTLIAGVLKVKSKIKKERTIPWLGRIPIIKYLFTSHSNTQKDTELAFLIQPEIIRDAIESEKKPAEKKK